MGLKRLCIASRRRLVSFFLSPFGQRCGMRFVNYVGMCYAFSMMTSMILLNVFVTCPKLYGAGACRGPIIFGSWVAFNTFLNWSLLLYYARLNNVLAHARGVVSCVADPEQTDCDYTGASAASESENNAFLSDCIPPSTSIGQSLSPAAWQQQWRPNSNSELSSRAISMDNDDSESTHLLIGKKNGFVDWSTAISIDDPPVNGKQGSSEQIDNSLAARTKFCARCDMRVPNRCHHCPVCNQCILLKDHHCFIVGACIGFGNHRYFITFLFWACIGSVYGSLYTSRLLASYFPPLWPYGWLDYIMPVALIKAVFYHTYPHWVAYVAFLFSAGCAGAYGSFGFLIAQFYLVLNGTTMWDYANRHKYPNQLSFNQRLRAVFGPWWLVNFLVPTGFPNRLDPQTSALIARLYNSPSPA